MSTTLNPQHGTGPCSQSGSGRRRALLILLFFASALSVEGARGIEADWIMYGDPSLWKPTIEVRFPEGLPALWIEALQRPERDLRRRAAAAIALAHDKGLPGLEVTVDALMSLLRRPEEDRTVRLTAARALIALDARQTAPLLFETLDRQDADFSELVEPALVRWEHPPMRGFLLERLAGDVKLQRMHMLAIRGLTSLGESRALPRLRQLAEDRRGAANVRLEAATALGKLQSTGLQTLARRLTAIKSAKTYVDRLVAARMLRSHRGEEAEQLLAELAIDPAPTVQAIALENLFRIDPNLIVPILGETITSDDANVRRWCAEALIAKPALGKLVQLVPLLDDPDPELRNYVCDALLELAQDDRFFDDVVARAQEVLDADSWRGQEQATLLLVSLDDESIVSRLFNLLDAPRAEVHATAAWGLRSLAVPSTAAPMSTVLQKKTAQILEGPPAGDRIYLQLSHLAQAMGQFRHADAETTLRQYIPKHTALHHTARAASIWALGHLYDGVPDDELASQLRERLLDFAPPPPLQPEAKEVRAMAAVTLGRMKATQTLPALRAMADNDGLDSLVGAACAWAIDQLTEEGVPEVEPLVLWEDDWFLTPNPGR